MSEAQAQTTETPNKPRRKRKPKKETSAATSAADTAAAEAKAKAVAAEKEARDALKKAEAEAKKAKEQAEKEAFRAKTEKGLETLARDINARFVRIEKYEGQADDHRLAAALNIAVAKEQCREAKINFKEWSTSHLHLPPKKEGGEPRLLSYETIRKLLPIGAAERDDEGAGKLMLEDMRDKNAAANKKARDKKKAEKDETGKSNNAPDPDKIRVQLDSLDPDDHDRLMRTQAKVHGKVLLDEDEAAEVSETLSMKPLDRAKRVFGSLTAKQKMEFVKYVCAEVGGSFSAEAPE